LKLFLVHHADAVGPEVDSRRPLSRLGEKQAAHAAAQAAALGAKPVVVWHSGKLRARQTALEYWRECNALAEFKAVADLQPDDPPARIRDRLRGEARDIMIAGHFPFMPRLLALLLNYAASAPFPLNGAVALDSDDAGETWKEIWRIDGSA
jgi:phosphohistidine phosphatase